MLYQYNCNKRYDYFKESQGRKNAVRKHCKYNHASRSGLSIESY